MVSQGRECLRCRRPICAVIYYAVLFACYLYAGQSTRYYTPAHLLSYVLLAYLLRLAWLRFLRKRRSRHTLAVLMTGTAFVIRVT